MEYIQNKSLIRLIIISLIILFLMSIKKEVKVYPVFKENNLYETYIIYFDDNYITTKNINDYIYDEIESIYLKDYKNISSNWYNINKKIGINKNIENIEKKYKYLLKENSLNEDTIYIDINGIKISKAIILTNDINKYNYRYEKY